MDTPAQNRIKAYNDTHDKTIKNELLQQMMTNLASLRTPESSDIILVCGEKEFCAHKAVLEASSPYFVGMFRSGMKEATAGKVKFDEVHPAVMDAILDFIYLGEVKKMQTTTIIKEVLVCAHLMELKDLFNYCTGFLEVLLSLDNFYEFWEISHKYEAKEFTEKILTYVGKHLSEVMDNSMSDLMSHKQLLDLVKFHKDKRNSLNNKILQLVVKWLMYDPAERDESARELFSHIDVSLVSKECIRSLLQDRKVMMASDEIENRMNKLGADAFLFFHKIDATTYSPPILPPSSNPSPYLTQPFQPSSFLHSSLIPNAGFTGIFQPSNIGNIIKQL